MSNRVTEIQQIFSTSTVPINIRYVPTASNPADYGTRPNTVSCNDLRNPKHPWWNGPSWLTEPEQSWPTDLSLNQTELPDNIGKQTAEERKITLVYHNTSTTSKTHWIEYDNIITRLDTSKPLPIKSPTHIRTRLSNVVAYIIRFIAMTFCPIFNRWPTNLKLTISCNNIKNFKHNSLGLHRSAFIIIIREHQQSHFADMLYNNKHQLWSQLNLKLDSNHLLRVHHRLNEPSPPFLIHGSSHLSCALIMDNLKKCNHMSDPSTLSRLRTDGIWIIRGRFHVKSVIKKCATCKYHFGGPFKQPDFPTLPSTRITMSDPFSKIGLDNFGPVNIRQGDTVHKVWTLIISCFTTRANAIQMEICSDMTSTSFLNAFIRFISRRGTPTHVLSDNAQNFSHAKDMILKHGQFNEQQEHITDLFKQKMIWTHITPKAAWMGATYERAIGAVKRALRTYINTPKTHSHL